MALCSSVRHYAALVPSSFGATRRSVAPAYSVGSRCADAVPCFSPFVAALRLISPPVGAARRFAVRRRRSTALPSSSVRRSAAICTPLLFGVAEHLVALLFRRFVIGSGSTLRGASILRRSALRWCFGPYRFRRHRIVTPLFRRLILLRPALCGTWFLLSSALRGASRPVLTPALSNV